ncbi:hypothetical protein DMX06_07880 [Pseudomonas mosselii]|nr:hypothetical protein DMX06_07880 [Pseudomonas mosselii]
MTRASSKCAWRSASRWHCACRSPCNRVRFFAGKPAPTGTPLTSTSARSLWERVYPRKGQPRR